MICCPAQIKLLTFKVCGKEQKRIRYVYFPLQNVLKDTHPLAVITEYLDNPSLIDYTKSASVISLFSPPHPTHTLIFATSRYLNDKKLNINQIHTMINIFGRIYYDNSIQFSFRRWIKNVKFVREKVRDEINWRT